jgi:hypothetical protein
MKNEKPTIFNHYFKGTLWFWMSILVFLTLTGTLIYLMITYTIELMKTI